MVAVTRPVEGSDDPLGGSFEEVYRAHVGRVRAVVRRRVPVVDDHEDLVQEVFVRVYARWDRVDPERPAWPLLRAITENLCSDRARRHAVRGASVALDGEALPASPTDGPDRVFERREAAAVFDLAFARLRERDRRLLALREFDQVPYQELAAAEGVSLDALKSALRRARRSLAHSAAAVVEGRLASIPAAVALWARRLAIRLGIDRGPRRAAQAGVNAEGVAALIGAAGLVILGAGLAPSPAPSHEQLAGGAVPTASGSPAGWTEDLAASAGTLPQAFDPLDAGSSAGGPSSTDGASEVGVGIDRGPVAGGGRIATEDRWLVIGSHLVFTDHKDDSETSSNTGAGLYCESHPARKSACDAVETVLPHAVVPGEEHP